VAAVRRQGIMGGTFDPVHCGHQELARFAQATLSLDGVLWIPAGQPWRKEGRPPAAAKHRLAMVRLAAEEDPTWRVSTIEMDRTGPTYTVDTIEGLLQQDDSVSYVLLMGQDALEDLPNWHRPDRLIELVELVVAPRGEPPQAGEQLDALLPGLSKCVTWLDMPLIPFSATQVRRLASRGTPLSGFVPDAVEAYIKEHRLYGAA